MHISKENAVFGDVIVRRMLAMYDSFESLESAKPSIDAIVDEHVDISPGDRRRLKEIFYGVFAIMER
jgi:hypothetical protein